MSGLDKNRKRNQTVCFRATPEERRAIEARVKASGMPKGEYCLNSLIHQKVIISVGKFESDKLALEMKRLRRQLDEAIASNDTESTEDLLKECRAFLRELMRIMDEQKGVKEENLQ